MFVCVCMCVHVCVYGFVSVYGYDVNRVYEWQCLLEARKVMKGELWEKKPTGKKANKVIELNCIEIVNCPK